MEDNLVPLGKYIKNSILKSNEVDKNGINLYLDEIECNFTKERDAIIRKVEHDIIDINQIMKDLSSLIETQGEMVDGIEYNIIKAVEETEKGTEDLENAKNIQTSTNNLRLKIATIVGSLTVTSVASALATLIIIL